MPKNKTIQGENPTIKFSTASAANSATPAVKRIDQYVTISHETHVRLGGIAHFNRAGYQEIVKGYNPDPKDEDSHVSFSLFYNSSDADKYETNPRYYLYITHFGRLHSCMNFYDVALLLEDYKAVIEEEINKRKA